MIDWDVFLNTQVLSAAVCAAVIAGIVNIVISLVNNRRLKAIEKEKHHSTMAKLRYEKLFEIFAKIQTYPESLPSDYPKGSLQYEKDFCNCISNQYSLVKHLLSQDIRTKIDKLYVSASSAFMEMPAEDFYHNEKTKETTLAWMIAQLEYRVAVKKGIQEQLAHLVCNE